MPDVTLKFLGILDVALVVRMVTSTVARRELEGVSHRG